MTVHEYTLEEAWRMGLLGRPAEPRGRTESNDDTAPRDTDPRTAESSRSTEAIFAAVPRARVRRPNPPEANDRFPMLAEACKKLRYVEKARTGLGNLAKPKKGRPAVLNPEELQVLLEPYDKLEASMDKEVLYSYYAEVPRAIQEWVEATPGLGANNVARVLGLLGHPVHACPHELKGDDLVALPEYHRSKRQWWAYSGNGDITRQPGRNFVGSMDSQAKLLAGGKQEARTRTHVVVQSCVKMTGKPDKNGNTKVRSPYRDTYEEAKLAAIGRGWGEEGRRVPYPANHADMHAYRVTRKQFLEDLYHAAQHTCGCP